MWVLCVTSLKVLKYIYKITFICMICICQKIFLLNGSDIRRFLSSSNLLSTTGEVFLSRWRQIYRFEMFAYFILRFSNY